MMTVESLRERERIRSHDMHLGLAVRNLGFALAEIDKIDFGMPTWPGFLEAALAHVGQSRAELMVLHGERP